MRLHYLNNTKGELSFFVRDPGLKKNHYEKASGQYSHTIAWNTGPAQKVTIDEVEYTFAENTVLPLMLNQSFHFENPETIIAWQFNREFYCIVNHDAEVGCVGFLFFGPSPTMFIQLDPELIRRLHLLVEIFEDEFLSKDNIQGDMLRILLVRLIIQLTRQAKLQYVPSNEIDDSQFNLIRQFNLLVEIHFRKEHQVKFYANELHKSPKTLSNLFAKCKIKSPQQTIQDRIILEAKRLFYYTEKSAKEIASELGFGDAAHFSRFFKNCTSISPSELKKQQLPPEEGKNVQAVG